jgi:hypothetical protein
MSVTTAFRTFYLPEHAVMWIRIAALALLIAAPLAGRADEPVLLSPHSGIESSTNTITEQLVEGGLLMARSCLACNSLPLRMTTQTELFIDKRAVTVGEFNKLVKAGGEHSLLIVYDKKTNTVVSLTVKTSTARS